MNAKSNKPSPAAAFAEQFLVGTLNSIVRAGAKAVESVAGDVKKALKKQAQNAEMLEKGVEMWRKFKVGEIDDDLPDSLKDNSKHKENGHG